MIWLALVIIFGGFFWVVFFGPPYVPTFKKDIETLLKLANLKPGQTIVDLGCGDGRLLIIAAELGLKAIGYEINPLLWLVSFLRTRRYGNLVSVQFKSLWRADLKHTDAVYVFLVGRLMPKLENKLRRDGKRGMVVISYVFQLRHLRPVKQTKNAYIYILT